LRDVENATPENYLAALSQHLKEVPEPPPPEFCGTRLAGLTSKVMVPPGGSGWRQIQRSIGSPAITKRVMNSIDRSAFDPRRTSAGLYRIGSLDDRDFAEKHTVFQIDERSKFQTQKGLIFGLVRTMDSARVSISIVR